MPTVNFDAWERKLRYYMAMIERRHYDEMTWACQQTTDITDDQVNAFDDDILAGECVGRSMALYFIPASFTEGTAFLIVDQLVDNNGYEACRRLTTLISIMSAKFPKDGFETALAKWGNTHSYTN